MLDTASPTPGQASGQDGAGATALKRGTLTNFDVLAQAVAQIAPSAIVGSEIGLVVSITGIGSWLPWTLGVAVYVLVGFALSQIAVRFSSTGGLYSLAEKAGGKTTSYVVLLGMLIGYLVAAPALVFQFAWFTSGYLNLHAFGIPDTHVTLLIVGLVGLAAAGWCSYAGAEFSTRTMLIAEIGSMLAIAVLLVIVLVSHPGGPFDHRMLTLHGLSAHKLLLAAPLILFACAGFESSAVLGEEAAKPRRTVPFAMIGSIAVVGIFLICCSYVLPLAFEGTHKDIATSANVLSDAASLSGASGYAYVIGAGVIISMFSVMIAVYNSGSRLLYTLSRERLMPRAFGYSHPKHRTPTKAILFIGAANLAGILIVVLTGRNILNAFGNLATLSGYGQTLMYIAALVSVAIFFVRRRRKESGAMTRVAISAVAIVPLGYVFYKYFKPFPPYPISVYLWIFIGLLAVAAAAYVWLRLVGRDAWARLGSLGVAVTPEDDVVGEVYEPAASEA